MTETVPEPPEVDTQDPDAEEASNPAVPDDEGG